MVYIIHTPVFLSAFCTVYPVISELPLSFGGVHSRAALKPHVSTSFTLAGGPGRSKDRNAGQKYIEGSHHSQVVAYIAGQMFNKQIQRSNMSLTFGPAFNSNRWMQTINASQSARWVVIDCIFLSVLSGHWYCQNKTHKTDPQSEGWLLLCLRSSPLSMSSRKCQSPPSERCGWKWCCLCHCSWCWLSWYPKAGHPSTRTPQAWASPLWLEKAEEIQGTGLVSVLLCFNMFICVC